MVRGFITIVSAAVLAAVIEAKPKEVTLASIPAVFEPNLGQARNDVLYLTRGPHGALYLREDAVVVQIPRSEETIEIAPRKTSSRPRVEGLGLQTGVSNYLRGEDESKWIRGVPHYSRVRYEGAFPGIDIVFYGTQSELEFDVVLRPHAAVEHVRFQVRGARKVRRNRDGSLSLQTARGELRLGRPFAYQPAVEGQRRVECSFLVQRDGGFGFRVGDYDRNQPLIIDPTLVTTYIGGNDV
ncbi:MAG: hypothetical protein JNK48_10210, partial [Bryobacterales bacterium]|nr:hypothetical protein [Bryobacterales bacterium]